MSSIPTKTEKCTGAMLASAIGDALGWPNELRAKNTSKNSKVYDYFVEWTRRCNGSNWHYEKIQPGEYSDDTQMILAVARSIIAGNWENIFINKELPYWLGYERGGGRALLKAANACKKGTLLWQTNYSSEYFNAGGNGTTMRILPHVIATSKTDDASGLMIDVIKDSIITHGHPRAILGATCYAYALDYLLRKESVLEYGELVAAVLEGQNIWGAFPDQLLFERWIDATIKVSNYDYKSEWNTVLANMLQQLDFIQASLKKGLMLNDYDVLVQLECFGKTNGAGDVAILAAIYIASKYANNPTLGIKTPAYSFGADTDTIASITGGLLGMLCGTNWIPAEWKMVQDYDCLVRIAEILLSENMAESAKTAVESVKEKYQDWNNTPIGKMHLLGTSTITSNKAVTVSVNKWESTLGQTLYFKGYNKNNYDFGQANKLIPLRSEMKTQERINVKERMEEKINSQFTLNISEIETLMEMPQLQRITFKKVLRVIKILLTSNDTTTSIAKQMDVDPDIVDLLKKYVKNVISI